MSEIITERIADRGFPHLLTFAAGSMPAGLIKKYWKA
jgi:hypothetical protein